MCQPVAAELPLANRLEHCLQRSAVCRFKGLSLPMANQRAQTQLPWSCLCQVPEGSSGVACLPVWAAGLSAAASPCLDLLHAVPSAWACLQAPSASASTTAPQVRCEQIPHPMPAGPGARAHLAALSQKHKRLCHQLLPSGLFERRCKRRLMPLANMTQAACWGLQVHPLLLATIPEPESKCSCHQLLETCLRYAFGLITCQLRHAAWCCLQVQALTFARQP